MPNFVLLDELTKMCVRRQWAKRGNIGRSQIESLVGPLKPKMAGYLKMPAIQMEKLKDW